MGYTGATGALEVIARGYKGLQGVTGGCNCHWELQGVTGG